MHISRVDLNLFVVFDAIYTEGGITAAARTLNLTQPVKVAKQTIVLDVYDPSYFVDFTLVPSEPALLVNAPAGCKLTVTPKGEPDAASAAILSQIPATERQLPAEYQSLTKDLVNRIAVTCP